MTITAVIATIIIESVTMTFLLAGLRGARMFVDVDREIQIKSWIVSALSLAVGSVGLAWLGAVFYKALG